MAKQLAPGLWVNNDAERTALDRAVAASRTPVAPFDICRLPSGMTIRTDATATKGAPTIDFETKSDGGPQTFVVATLVEPANLDGRL